MPSLSECTTHYADQSGWRAGCHDCNPKQHTSDDVPWLRPGEYFCTNCDCLVAIYPAPESLPAVQLCFSCTVAEALK